MTDTKRQAAFTKLREAAREHGSHATDLEECPFKEGSAFFYDWRDAMEATNAD